MQISTFVLLCCVTATCLVGAVVWDLIKKVEHMQRQLDAQPLADEDATTYQNLTRTR